VLDCLYTGVYNAGGRTGRCVRRHSKLNPCQAVGSRWCSAKRDRKSGGELMQRLPHMELLRPLQIRCVLVEALEALRRVGQLFTGTDGLPRACARALYRIYMAPAHRDIPRQAARCRLNSTPHNQKFPTASIRVKYSWKLAGWDQAPAAEVNAAASVLSAMAVGRGLTGDLRQALSMNCGPGSAASRHGWFERVVL